MEHPIERREGQFRGRNDLSIHWRAWLPAGRSATLGSTVVIVHGLGEHGGRYARLAEFLVGRGSAVYAIDHRGHGRSEGPRAFVDRFDNAVADLDLLVDRARKEQLGVPLFLLGHSMGGALALEYAFAHQQKLDGLILSGPAVALDGASGFTLLLSKVLSSVAPSLGLFAVDPSAVSQDETEVAAYAADPLNFHGKVPARTMGEIVRFVERVPPRLSQLTLPLLIVHGKADKLAGVSGSEMVCRSVGSADKTLTVYDGLYHEVFNERPEGREKVMADVAGWIKARSASAVGLRATS
jgi:alpha-beta hydrolase superfamily lysophospholipase